jgi:hypothetical protein
MGALIMGSREGKTLVNVVLHDDDGMMVLNE